MKRLAMLFVAVMTTAVFAQGREFNGSWVLDAAKTGSTQGPPAVTIVLTAKEFKLTISAGERVQTIVLKTDGTETDVDHGDKGKAEWKGDKLVATITSSRGPSSVTFSREGAWLVQEGEGGGRAPAKLYFKKAPAK